MKNKQKDEQISSREYKMKRKKETLDCTYCRPHSGENATYKKHGKQKPKYKDK